MRDEENNCAAGFLLKSVILITNKSSPLPFVIVSNENKSLKYMSRFSSGTLNSLLFSLVDWWNRLQASGSILMGAMYI